jgi:hypothetical protein
VQRNSPAYHAPVIVAALTLRDLAQQVERMDTLLTEACGGRCCGAAQKSMMAGGAGGRDSWGKPTQGDSGVLGSLDRLGWSLGRRCVGGEGPRSTGGEQLCGRLTAYRNQSSGKGQCRGGSGG